MIPAPKAEVALEPLLWLAEQAIANNGRISDDPNTNKDSQQNKDKVVFCLINTDSVFGRSWNFSQFLQ